ncbi:hypothetical protein JTE90_008983 [Oedothorax gibbosus]|uniref:Uncharacterized protein n=1 Tax=Oedothorax gibbosus TaxID=931172 RepID=A0AAV6UKT2_9ARAC|nr:hypothetical protein JTE90_008983 [Oedothorax gibbosus]
MRIEFNVAPIVELETGSTVRKFNEEGEDQSESNQTYCPEEKQREMGKDDSRSYFCQSVLGRGKTRVCIIIINSGLNPDYRPKEA